MYSPKTSSKYKLEKWLVLAARCLHVLQSFARYVWPAVVCNVDVPSNNISPRDPVGREAVVHVRRVVHTHMPGNAHRPCVYWRPFHVIGPREFAGASSKGAEKAVAVKLFYNGSRSHQADIFQDEARRHVTVPWRPNVVSAIGVGLFTHPSD